MSETKFDLQKKQSDKQLKKLATAQDYKDVFKSERGKRVLSDLMMIHKVTSSTVIFNQATGMMDPLMTAHREGERAVILRILQLMKLDLQEFKDRMEMAEKHARENGIL